MAALLAHRYAHTGLAELATARARQVVCVNGQALRPGFFPCAAGCRGGGKVEILGLDFHFSTAP
jgi:hypothetical protein